MKIILPLLFTYAVAVFRSQDKKNAWSQGTRNLWKLINAKKKENF